MASPSLQHQLFFHRPAFFVYSRQTLSLLPASTLYLRACCTRDRCPFLPLPAPSCTFRHASAMLPRIPAHSRGFSPCQLSPPAPAFPVFAAVLSSPAPRAFPRIPAASARASYPRLPPPSQFLQPCCPALLSSPAPRAFPRIPAASTCSSLPLPALMCLLSAPPLHPPPENGSASARPIPL